MTNDEVLAKLAAANRSQVQKDTGIPYMTLCKMVWGYEGKQWGTKFPRAERIEQLRDYFERRA